MKSNIRLQRVEYVPKALGAGILYVSERFQVAAHLCPCGCGNKIVTPLGPTEWKFSENNDRPSLYPSVGNWQIPCRSHYWITEGVIDWSYPWTEEQIKEGRESEEEKRKSYYEKKVIVKKKSLWMRLINWISGK